MVLYNSRTTVDKLLEHIRATGAIDQFTFGQKRDPCSSFFKKVMSTFTRASNIDGNIGVTLSVNPPGLTPDASSDDGSVDGQDQRHASDVRSLWAKTDSALFKQIDPETLEPLGIATQDVLHPDLTGPLSAAHAKSDPHTGDIFNYNLEMGAQATYRVFRVSADTGETDILATITDAEAAYLHSLMITRNHVVLCVWGGRYAYHGLKMLVEKNILDALAPFDPTKPAKWYVIDKGGGGDGGGLVATYTSDPFFCFHTVNAWEEPSESESESVSESDDPDAIDIVAELVAYENVDVLKRFYYDNLLSTAPASRGYMGEKGDSSRPQLTRWRLGSVPSKPEASAEGTQPQQSQQQQQQQQQQPLPPRRAHQQWAAPRAASPELPVINPGYRTIPHRFVYGIADRGKSTFFDGLVKFDTCTQKAVYWERHGHSPGEPIFVPDPAGYDEDDGVLLSVVLDGPNDHSYLVCLDATDMRELGRAMLDGVVIAFGFHGAHVPASSSSLAASGGGAGVGAGDV